MKLGRNRHEDELEPGDLLHVAPDEPIPFALTPLAERFFLTENTERARSDERPQRAQRGGGSR